MLECKPFNSIIQAVVLIEAIGKVKIETRNGMRQKKKFSQWCIWKWCKPGEATTLPSIPLVLVLVVTNDVGKRAQAFNPIDSNPCSSRLQFQVLWDETIFMWEGQNYRQEMRARILVACIKCNIQYRTIYQIKLFYDE